MMIKTKVSLTEEIDQKVNEYKLINDLNYSQAIRKLVELGVESLNNQSKIIDIYKEIKAINSKLIYLNALIEQFYSDMEVDGGTNPKTNQALKLFWSKRLKDPFND